MWAVVNLTIEVLISQNSMDELPRVMEPDMIFFCHLQGWIGVWKFTQILEGEHLPGDVTEVNLINSVESIFSVLNGCLSARSSVISISSFMLAWDISVFLYVNSAKWKCA